MGKAPTGVISSKIDGLTNKHRRDFGPVVYSFIERREIFVAKKKGVIGYFIDTMKVRRQANTLQEISEGEDEDLLKVLRGLIAIEQYDYPKNNPWAEPMIRWLEVHLREVLITPSSELGKHRRRMLRKAGYDVYLCGEEDYKTCTVGVRCENHTVFAEAA
jgi:hypothetical protein